MNDNVKITCYGDTETMKRGEAINFYQKCIDGSDGHERERYVNIVIGLNQGLMEVDDGEDW